jgi:hypothetical protein
VLRVADLAFAHETVPAYKRTAGGVEVPCDGPNALVLDNDNRVRCADCDEPLVRVDEPPASGATETEDGSG